MNCPAFLPPTPIRRRSAPCLNRRYTLSSKSLATCSISPPERNAPPPKPDHDQGHTFSRRAFLALVAAAAVSASPLTDLPTSVPPSHASGNVPLLKDDFDLPAPRKYYEWDGFNFEHDPLLHDDFLWGTEREASEDLGTATYEDYLGVLKIPPIDWSLVARDYTRTACFIAIPASLIAAASAFSSRTSSRVRLPSFYDAEALKRYFSVRPDAVLRRLTQFAVEGISLAFGISVDRLVESADDFLVLVRLQTPDTQRTRARERVQRRGVLLRKVITRLGPAVIKLGQATASRPDLVSALIVRELQPLQDDVLADFPTEQAFAVIRDELGASVHAIFDEIDPEPVAGASLGMVFKARVDGDVVAVKVQRPEVAASIALDCYILRCLALTSKSVFGLRTDWRVAVDEYSTRLFEELDYTNELNNMVRFRKLYSDYEGIYLPRVFPQYCSQRVLVTEWIDGEKLIDEDVKVRPEDIGLVETGIRFALMQLLDKGLLHADMHNGNMLRTKSGNLAYIDFGLVSDVPAGVRESIVCALVHLIHGEYSLLAETFLGLELMRSDDIEVELPVLAEALREAFEPEDTPSCDLPSATPRRFRNFTLIGVVTKLLTLGSRFPLVFRDYFLNNLRCLGMLEGLALNADANFNVLSVVYPYVVKKILTGSTPRYRNALESLVIDSYGRMRWARIEQLLVDAQATSIKTLSMNLNGKSNDRSGATSQAVPDVQPITNTPIPLPEQGNVATMTSAAATSAPTNVTEDALVGNSDFPTRPNRSTYESYERSASVVLRFITSDTGHFLRRYFAQQYLLNVELTYRRRIDKLFRHDAETESEDQLSIPLVNATSSISQNAASRWLALHSTARDLSDDEARLRTRSFFRSTPFLKKVGVLMRLLPGSIVPWMKTALGVAGYFIHRWMQARVWKQKVVLRDEEVDGKNSRVGLSDVVDGDQFASQSLADDSERGAWRGFASSFSRKTQIRLIT